MKALRCIVIIILFLSCSNQKQTLHVALYPYIPAGNEIEDFSPLVERIKREFKRIEPDIDLQLKISTKLDPYTLLNEESFFKDYDVIEIDGLILGEIVENDWVHELNFQPDNFMQVATDIFSVNKKMYGAPTWLCGLFEFSKDVNFNQPVVGEFLGSWRTTLYLLESILDNRTDEKPSFLSKLYEPHYYHYVTDVVEKCRIDGEIPCLSKMSMADQTRRFIESEVLLLGYGETLHYLIAQKASDVYIRPAQFGEKNSLISLADGLVVNKKRCLDQCFVMANKFIQYFTSPEVQTWITLNHDNPQNAPRFLVSSNNQARASLTHSTSPYSNYYKTFYDHFSVATPAPNNGIVHARSAVNEMFKESLFKRRTIDSTHPILEEEK